jgi:hypothetical protein
VDRNTVLVTNEYAKGSDKLGHPRVASWYGYCVVGKSYVTQKENPADHPQGSKGKLNTDACPVRGRLGIVLLCRLDRHEDAWHIIRRWQRRDEIAEIFDRLLTETFRPRLDLQDAVQEQPFFPGPGDA